MNLLIILLLWYADLGVPRWLQIFGSILIAINILCDTCAQMLNRRVVTIEKVAVDEGDKDND